MICTYSENVSLSTLTSAPSTPRHPSLNLFELFATFFQSGVRFLQSGRLDCLQRNVQICTNKWIRTWVCLFSLVNRCSHLHSCTFLIAMIFAIDKASRSVVNCAKVVPSLGTVEFISDVETIEKTKTFLTFQNLLTETFSSLSARRSNKTSSMSVGLVISLSFFSLWRRRKYCFCKCDIDHYGKFSKYQKRSFNFPKYQLWHFLAHLMSR